MANKEQLDILKQGVKVWNQWRENNSTKLQINLTDADLMGANLVGVDFHGVNLQGAKLRPSNTELGRSEYGAVTMRTKSTNLYGANLRGANLSDADLHSANLRGANLSDADLHSANLSLTRLSDANFNCADLRLANLNSSALDGANLNGAILGYTSFGDVDLSTVKGLETVRHIGPSTIGIDTIISSHGNIPEAFLQGVGIDDTFITYIRSLIGKPIEYYSCFISYSSKDEAFARRLYADLQSHNVRCWFAPEDLKIGDKIRSRIDESIRMYDRLLLVLSEHSVSSKWVEFEVEVAMDKEQDGKPPVLFPVRLDNTVMESTTAWAAHIKRTRHIGDFTCWKNHDDFQKAFRRLLKDLKAERTKRESTI